MATTQTSRKSVRKTATATSRAQGSKNAVSWQVQPATKAKQTRQSERLQLPLASTLGQTIKAMRIAKNWSQEQLAGEIECDRSALGLIEQGKSNPSIFMLSVLAGVFGLTLSQLLAPITADMNLKPTWQDTTAIKRRSNRSTPERRPAPTRRLR